MPIIIADLHVTPIGTGSVGVSQYIAATQDVLKAFPDLTVQLNPMTTSLQGELDRVLAAVKAMHESPFTLGVQRVSTTVRIDDRRDGQAHTLAERVQAVRDHQR